MSVIIVKNAYDKGSALVDTPEQLLQLARSYEYQRLLDEYRQGRSDCKLQLLGILPQARRIYANATGHTLRDLVRSGCVFLDDDRSAEEISAAERHRQVEALLTERGMSDIPHIAMQSASRKYHLLMPSPGCGSLQRDWEYWRDFFDGVLVLDPSTTNVNRVQFFTGELFTPDESLGWLFQENVNVDVNENEANSQQPQPDGELSIVNCQLSTAQAPLADLAASIVTQICGSATPVEGTRNHTLFEAAKTMAYIEGITLQDMLDAFAELGYLGLSRREARQCIRSAMRQEKSWLYIEPPMLTEARAQCAVAHVQGVFKNVNYNDNVNVKVDENENCLPDGSFNIQHSTFNNQQPQPDGSFNIQQSTFNNQQPQSTSSSTSVTEPRLVSLFTSRVPANAREATASMLFSPLASYLNNTVTIRDVSNKVRNIQFSSIVVGNSSCGKGFVDFISDAIMERRRQQDMASWQALTAWEEQKRQLAKGKPSPIKPKVPLYLLVGNMTEPALLERMAALEPVMGRGYLKVSEIDMLRKLQSASSRLGGGQEIILSAFDTIRDYGALRVSAEAVSTITTLSLNLVASSTFPGTQQFFTSGIERGTVGRCDISIVPDTCEVPQYGALDADFDAELNHYIDLLQGATGEIVCPECDALIELIRQEYNDPTSQLCYEKNAEYYKLCHRQLLITKQKGIVLYICNAYQWDPSWEEWLRTQFYYGMRCKISVFANEIASWQRRQHSSVIHISVSKPKSDLEQLPETFSTNDLIALKQSLAAPGTDVKTINKRVREQLRQWTKRANIQPIGNDGQQWQQLK